jgi:hypothetical protein
MTNVGAVRPREGDDCIRNDGGVHSFHIKGKLRSVPEGEHCLGQMEERLETGSAGVGRLALTRRMNSRQCFHAKLQQKRGGVLDGVRNPSPVQ